MSASDAAANLINASVTMSPIDTKSNLFIPFRSRSRAPLSATNYLIINLVVRFLISNISR